MDAINSLNVSEYLFDGVLLKMFNIEVFKLALSNSFPRNFVLKERVDNLEAQ